MVVGSADAGCVDDGSRSLGLLGRCLLLALRNATEAVVHQEMLNLDVNVTWRRPEHRAGRRKLALGAGVGDDTDASDRNVGLVSHRP